MTDDPTHPTASGNKDTPVKPVQTRHRVGTRLRSIGGWLWHHLSGVLTVAAIGCAFWLGSSLNTGHGGNDHSAKNAGTPEIAQAHTCSMHPQIRQDGTGLCPICNMELVPVKEEGPPVGAREVSLSDTARALAEVATTTVERKPVEVEIRMVGKVHYDETRVHTIAAWLDGRIERHYADFVGKMVAAGDPLVDLYSPGLFVAQQELLLSLDAARASDNGSAADRGNFLLATAAREKLRLLGLSPEQVAAIETAGTPQQTITIPAPQGGTVVARQSRAGMYVREGDPLVTVADLSRVWVKLDAFERDIAWLRVGQKVTLETEAFPGLQMEGAIRFIDPFVDPATRTARVRVEVPNSDGLLKPEMFARARVQVPIAELNGTYRSVPPLPHTCSMHPHVRTDGPGQCPVCAMDLVPLAGSDQVASAGRPPLVVPLTAILRTGKRAVAYVERTVDGAHVYQGRTVVLGPTAGHYVVVKSGLKQGEKVVTQGNFKIDAALQILAKPSMMSLPSEQAIEPVPTAFKEAIAPLYASYFAIWEALKDDSFAPSRAGFEDLVAALDGVSTESLSSAQGQRYSSLATMLRDAATQGGAADSIQAARGHFEPLSKAILTLQRQFGHTGSSSHYEMYCPMAFDNRGAPWLQATDELLNPYFGDSMLRCGETRETFIPDA